MSAAPKKRYANTTERTMAAEGRIRAVVRGLLNQIERTDFMLAPEHSMMRDRRVRAALKLLKDMGRPYRSLYVAGGEES